MMFYVYVKNQDTGVVDQDSTVDTDDICVAVQYAEKLARRLKIGLFASIEFYTDFAGNGHCAHVKYDNGFANVGR